MNQDVFVSYSRVDLPFVERLVAFLKDAEASVWFDQTSLLPGRRWEDVIEDEIPNSRTFLVCLSKAAMARAGYFHVEQHRASDAALRIPPERLFVLPVLLGDCEIPRKFKQYHAVNLIEPGAIEMLLRSLSSALERELVATPDAVERLRNELVGHLGAEGSSNQDFVNRFMQTEEISFQDSVGLIERIANSSDPDRLGILLKLRAHDMLSYAEQAALDIAIGNIKAGRRTTDTQAAVKGDELGRIAQMAIPGNAEATALLQINKYVRYISRKGTQPYKMAEAKIQNLLAGRD
ncbi:hypothetical protein BMW22_05140 [Rhizobium leguminosarum]|uniref:TIR domain-containing protein n=1 Tax=Rhizobium leguminosarum TaxID=384 RepID=A0A1L3Z6C1_RHILE|nr:toll/interleukin-1 receptor domain-containing protein [Rhizobium leguminosarum]API51110.1 hypothetical protein BMW22_05140 [Rhizobium leguminosarum]